LKFYLQIYLCAVEVGESQGLLTFAAIFILLRAFANGGSSLTGLEAISDGVALFKTPEEVNARRTLVCNERDYSEPLVLGVSWFAHSIHAMPYEGRNSNCYSSEIAKTIHGRWRIWKHDVRTCSASNHAYFVRWRKYYI
jgi:hypothetical protein